MSFASETKMNCAGVRKKRIAPEGGGIRIFSVWKNFFFQKNFCDDRNAEGRPEEPAVS